MSKFLHDDATDDVARAMTIPQRFFENSRAKNEQKLSPLRGPWNVNYETKMAEA